MSCRILLGVLIVWTAGLQACAATISSELVVIPSKPERSKDEYAYGRPVLVGMQEPTRLNVVESLIDRIWVKTWTKDALVLEDGRLVKWTAGVDLRHYSIELDVATRSGVEVSDTDVVGLVRVHHWCGNDSVRWHEARVSIPDLLRFVSEKRDSDAEHAGFSLQSGWDVDWYHSFLRWQTVHAGKAELPKIALRAKDQIRLYPVPQWGLLAIFDDGTFRIARGAIEQINWIPTIHGGRLPAELFQALQESLPTRSEREDPPTFDATVASNQEGAAAVEKILSYLRYHHP